MACCDIIKSVKITIQVFCVPSSMITIIEKNEQNGPIKIFQKCKKNLFIN